MEFHSGLPETLCGAGSTVHATEELRSALRVMLCSLEGVERILDAPCGDFNWMSLVDLSGFEYVGCDFDPRHIEKALWLARDRAGISFVSADIVREPLPACDLVICRDFLQHVRDGEIVAALRNFVATGAKWIALTSHRSGVNQELIRTGDFRPVDLEAPPYSFGSPAFSVSDGDRRFLGVWSIEVVKEWLRGRAS